MAQKPPMQVHVQSSDFKELLKVQKESAATLTTLVGVMEKMSKNAISSKDTPEINRAQLKAIIDVEIKQRLRLKDLHEREIKHLEEKHKLTSEEAKAISSLVKGMKTFPTIMQRLQDKAKPITEFMKNPLAGLRMGMLKSTNILGINNKRIEREKFIKTQTALGADKSRSELKKDFEQANKLGIDIKKNEEQLSKLKKDTGMSESQLAKTQSGKELLDKRKELTSEYTKVDKRAELLTSGKDSKEASKETAEKIKPSEVAKPASSAFADEGALKEQANEDAKLMNEQTALLKQIEENTRPDEANKVKPKKEGSEEGGGGLLSGLLGGGKAGGILKGLKDFGIGMVLIAGSLWVAAKAFTAFGEVEWADVGKGLIVLAGFVATAKILKSGSGDMIKAAFGIGALSLALYGSAKALTEFANVDWNSIAKAGVTLIGLGVAGSVIGAMLPSMIKAAAGIGAMSLAIYGLGTALKEIGENTWETMAKAGVAIAALAAGAVLMAPAILPMLGAGAALGVMGAGLWVVGKAIEAVSEGFAVMVSNIERLSNNVNGDNLLNVAKGLLAVAGAMVAFGGAQALAGLGNLVGKLLSFGSDSPLEQLEKISKYGDGINKAGSGMKRLGEGMKAFNDIKPDALQATLKVLENFPWVKAALFSAAGGSVTASDGGKTVTVGASKAAETAKAPENVTKAVGRSIERPSVKAAEPVKEGELDLTQPDVNASNKKYYAEAKAKGMSDRDARKYAGRKSSEEQAQYLARIELAKERGQTIPAVSPVAASKSQQTDKIASDSSDLAAKQRGNVVQDKSPTVINNAPVTNSNNRTTNVVKYNVRNQESSNAAYSRRMLADF